MKTDISSQLNGFIPSGDTSGDIECLWQILDGFENFTNRSAVLPALFGVLERNPGVDLGSPGPIVHSIAAVPGYLQFLTDSIRKAPHELSVWMVNRALNGEQNPSKRAELMAILQSVANSTGASQETRKSADEFLEFQTKEA